ncbi:hypothetical protein GQ600_7535 [Phytophthora cactorum]|nr:hypothetical protein GQ600_7535 [Phytophthora cactorum]
MTTDIVAIIIGVELSDDDAVAEMILDSNHESPRNASSVHQSARGDTGAILVTYGHMRVAFRRCCK